MFQLSRTLDHVGLFARTVEDVALLAEQLVGYDERDPDSRPRARIPFREVAAEEPPIAAAARLRQDVALGPTWTPTTREAFAELVGTLGDRVEEVELSGSPREALEWHRPIMDAEMAANLDREWEHGARPPVRRRSGAQLERGPRGHGRRLPAGARAARPALADGLAELFAAALRRHPHPGRRRAPRPRGLESTGDPRFCTLWTLCGMPALSCRSCRATNGLPLGVQLVGPRHGDARLLRTARWLARRVEAS